MISSPVIEVLDVHKRFGRGRGAVHALRGVSLAVGPGQIYGLLGRNGAGKTTLVKVLLDIVRADRGMARLDGQSCRRPAARRRVGYLPEDHQFPGYRTGEGAVGFYAALSGLGGGRVRHRTVELLRSLHLEAAARRKVRGYSKGMKQRLALAQALVHDPAVLLLDEPTDGVDPVGRAEIRDLLLSLREEGRTIFLNSHLLGEVEQVCDRVAILSDGALVAEGSVAELTATDRLYRVRLDREPTPEELDSVRQRTVTCSADGSQLAIELAVETELDGVVDALRAAGLGIRELTAKKPTLEEVFLRSVEARSEGGAA